MFFSVLKGGFCGFALAFLLLAVGYSGIYRHYIVLNAVPEFFNSFFVNSLPLPLFVILAAIFALIFWHKIGKILYLVLLFCSLLLFLEPFGNAAGRIFFEHSAVVEIDGAKIKVNAIYENKFYIFYLANPNLKSNEIAARRENIRYYEKPILDNSQKK